MLYCYIVIIIYILFLIDFEIFEKNIIYHNHECCDAKTSQIFRSCTKFDYRFFMYNLSKYFEYIKKGQLHFAHGWYKDISA